MTDIGAEAACAEMVGKLSESIKQRVPKASRGDSGLKSAEQIEKKTTRSPLDTLVLRLLGQCHATQAPVSALSFWNESDKPAGIADLHESEWLYGLALYMDSNPLTAGGGKTTDHARLYVHARARHALSGTHELVDLTSTLPNDLK